MNGRATAPQAATEAGAAARPASRRWSDLLPRALSAIVLVALALGTAKLGGAAFELFWLLWEWQRLIGPHDAFRRVVTGAVSLLLAVALAVAGWAGWAVLAVALGMVGAAALAGPGRRMMAACGILYAASLALAVTWLRLSASGLVAILWLFAVVWGTDVMAYFGGRLIGGPKLWPRLSPSKTWSGFVVGVTSGGLLGLAVAPAGSRALMVVLVGIAAGVLAQAGDILESAIKRRYGVKDTSRLIPGHGGAMDRLDGFLTAAVFALGLGAARAGLDAAGVGLFNWP